jgi:hypothetical protein
MTKNTAPHASEIAIDSIVTLIAEYAERFNFNPDTQYTVTGRVSIGKASYCTIASDDDSFRVHPKYFASIEAPKPERKQTSHAACSHPSTKTARAKCRKARKS